MVNKNKQIIDVFLIAADARGLHKILNTVEHRFLTWGP